MLVKEIHDAWGKKNYVYTYICICICVCKYIYIYIHFEANFLFLSAEIRYVSLWQTFRNSVMFKLFQAENMEVKYLYSFFIQRNQTMEAAPSNM